jgi:hypothetical protein
VYYLADEHGVHFVWQPSQKTSVLAMSCAFDDYYIKDYVVILAPEVTQRRTTAMTTRYCQGSFCVGLPLILFANTYTCLFLFKQACMVVRT